MCSSASTIIHSSFRLDFDRISLLDSSFVIELCTPVYESQVQLFIDSGEDGKEDGKIWSFIEAESELCAAVRSRAVTGLFSDHLLPLEGDEEWLIEDISV